VYYEEIGEYMNAMYPTTYGADTEADDLIAMRADQLRGNSEFVVVTIDKDMDQIEGLHYNWVKEEAVRLHYKPSPGTAPTTSKVSPSGDLLQPWSGSNSVLWITRMISSWLRTKRFTLKWKLFGVLRSIQHWLVYR
jgi:hypothetical protein